LHKISIKTLIYFTLFFTGELEREREREGRREREREREREEGKRE